MSDETTTTTPAPTTEPTAPAPAGDDEIVALASQLLGGGQPEGNAATAPSSTPSDAPAPGEPADRGPFDLPDLAEIEAKAKERQQQAAARAREQAPLDALAKLQSQIDELTAKSLTPATLQDPDKALAALQQQGLDPDAVIAALARKRLEQRGQAATPGLTSVEQKLQALTEKLDALTQPQQAQQQAPLTPERIEGLQQEFAHYVHGAAELYPAASRLPPATVGLLGWDYVARLAKAGYDTAKITDAQIAAAVERTLNGGPSKVTTTANGGTPALNGGAAPTQAANGGTTTSTPSAPRSLSPGLAAEGVRQPPADPADAFEDAVAFAASLLQRGA